MLGQLSISLAKNSFNLSFAKSSFPLLQFVQEAGTAWLSQVHHIIFPSSLTPLASGQVLTWGQNEYGQLGHGRIGLPFLFQFASPHYVGQGEHKPTPIILPQGAPIKFAGIAAGARHSFALSRTSFFITSYIDTLLLFSKEDGRIFSWGAGEFGQLGHGDLEQRLLPKRIEDPKNVKCSSSPTHLVYFSFVCADVLIFRFVQVDGGTWHSLALSSDGDVYSWGGGGYGQLGHLNEDELEKIAYRPTRVTFPDGVKIVKVAAGENFSVALSRSGDIYTWGSNNAGQLGFPTRKVRAGRFNIRPRKVEVGSHIIFKDIAAGAAHTLALRGAHSLLC